MSHPSLRPRLPVLVLLGVVSLPCRVLAVQQWSIVDPPSQGTVTLSSGGTGAAELSGLTWAGGTQFYAVSDDVPRVFPLTIAIDGTLGTITSASLGPGLALAAGADAEGIAYHAAHASVYVSDEVGPAIREFSLANGGLLQTLAVPAVFSNQRPNLGLESLSLEAGHQALWTANEEALTVDGPLSSSAAGTVVRLQKFNAALQPAGQWAYVTDPIAGDIGNPGRDIEVSGVVDLVALPGGQLLVLERELGFGLFRNRIYEVDFTGATDVSALAGLAGATYTPVGKILLWEGFLGANFEGVALGPAVADGGRSLLLVSDNGGGLSQRLNALILSPYVAPTPTPTPTPEPLCGPAPRADCRTPARSALTLAQRGGARDSLVWAWRRGTVPTTAPFGDPTGLPPTRYALCVYDTSSGVEQLRMTLAIAGGPGWRTLRAAGFKLTDKAGTSDGVTAVKLQAGDGRALILVRGKGAGLRIPPPSGAAPLLANDPRVTVQLVNGDDPAACFGAVYDTATRATPQLFKARF